MIIGITGSFGSGKTTVAKMFGRLGACVIDADKVAHSLMLPSGKVYKKIVKNFGNSILRKDKKIDRKRLAKIVFKNKPRLALLDRLIHPETIKEIQRIIRRNKKRLIVIDAPLLVESGFYKKLDRLVVVKNNIDTQVNRISRMKNIKKRAVLQRIRMQAPLKKKLAFADFIIDNSGSRSKTLPQVQRIWKNLRGDLWQ